MIVFDLRCGAGHVFEAWFGSSDDYADQKARGLLSCPMCADSAIEKAVMAPNVSPKGNRGAVRAVPADDPPVPAAMPVPAEKDPAAVKRMLGELARAQAKLLENSRWVGRDFAREARAIHDGDSEQRTIHGEASPAEVKALLDDGIGVAPLPLPITPPEKRN